MPNSSDARRAQAEQITNSLTGYIAHVIGPRCRHCELTQEISSALHHVERDLLNEFTASCEVAESPEIERHILGVVEGFRRRKSESMTTSRPFPELHTRSRARAQAEELWREFRAYPCLSNHQSPCSYCTMFVERIAAALAKEDQQARVVVCNHHYNSENATISEHTGQEGRCEYCWREYKRGFDEGYENGQDEGAEVSLRHQ